MRSAPERLLDILEAIERIEKYAEEGKEAFHADELIQTWMVHYLTIIGEACRTPPDDFQARHQARHANIPWADIVGMRNILVHHYFGIDADAVWSIVGKRYPRTETQHSSSIENPMTLLIEEMGIPTKRR